MAEGVEEIGQALVLAEEPVETVAVDVVEAEELLGAFEAAIGGAAPGRAPFGVPRPLLLSDAAREDPTRRSRLPPTLSGSAGRASGCVFFPVEVGIL
jgi:hypothetical protein